VFVKEKKEKGKFCPFLEEPCSLDPSVASFGKRVCGQRDVTFEVKGASFCAATCQA
jgi:hypothetical protein